jgi:hypothetical protein
LLSECDLFQELNDTQIDKLVAIAKEQSVPEGTLLYTEGDPSPSLKEAGVRVPEWSVRLKKKYQYDAMTSHL